MYYHIFSEKYKDNLINFFILSNKLYSYAVRKLLETKLSFMNNLKYLIREISIRKRREFHVLTLLLTLRTLFTKTNLFYSMKKHILMTSFKKWKYKKFAKVIRRGKIKRSLRGNLIITPLKKVEFYSKIYCMLYFFRNVKRMNYKFDKMFNQSILFLKSLCRVIQMHLKKAKCKFLLSMEQSVTEEEMEKLNTIYKCKAKTSKIKNDYRNVFIRAVGLKICRHCLERENVNKFRAKYFSLWKRKTLLLNIEFKSRTFTMLNEVMFNSNLEILYNVITSHVLFYFKFFIFQISHPYQKITILDLEVKANENLHLVMKGFYLYSKIRASREEKLIKMSKQNILTFAVSRWRQRKKILMKVPKNIPNQQNKILGLGWLISILKLRKILFRRKKLVFSRLLLSHKTSPIPGALRIVAGLKKVFIRYKILLSKKIIEKIKIIHRKNHKNNKAMSRSKLFFYLIHNYYNENQTTNKKIFISKLKLASQRLPKSPFSFADCSFRAPSPKKNNNLSSLNFTPTNFYTLFISLESIIHVIKANTSKKFLSLLKQIKKHSLSLAQNRNTMNKRIIDNLSLVSLAMHNEISTKTKHLKLIKLITLIDKKNSIKYSKAKNIRFYFRLWVNPNIFILSSIQEGKDFQLDIKIQIYEYQEVNKNLEDKLGEISDRAEKCKKCSTLLQMSTLSVHSKRPRRKTIEVEEKEPDDAELIDNDPDGGEYYEYLEKTEKEIKNNIIQIRTVKEPILQKLKKEVESLCEEIDTLSNNKK